jgi:hypothetical protein
MDESWDPLGTRRTSTNLFHNNYLPPTNPWIAGPCNAQKLENERFGRKIRQSIDNISIIVLIFNFSANNFQMRHLWNLQKCGNWRYDEMHGRGRKTE